MSWEIVDDFTIYVCRECENDITVYTHEKPPDKCPYCTGEKVSRKNIIKKLALALYDRGQCITGATEEICSKYSEDSNGCINCWIAWAEEK